MVQKRCKNANTPECCAFHTLLALLYCGFCIVYFLTFQRNVLPPSSALNDLMSSIPSSLFHSCDWSNFLKWSHIDFFSLLSQFVIHLHWFSHPVNGDSTFLQIIRTFNCYTVQKPQRCLYLNKHMVLLLHQPDLSHDCVIARIIM